MIQNEPKAYESRPENEGSSGDVDENKGNQVSGAWCQVSAVASTKLAGARWAVWRGKQCKMKVHPGMLMKTKNSRFEVSGSRCQWLRAKCALPDAKGGRPHLRPAAATCGHNGRVGGPA